MAQEARDQLGSGIAAFIAIKGGKTTISVAVSGDLTARFSAVELVRAANGALGGKGGGGKPELAQAGGPATDQPEAGLQAIRDILKS